LKAERPATGNRDHYEHSRISFFLSVTLDSSTPGRDLQQLPPGRHGLSRSFVVRNQRERILAAVAQASSEQGYGDMSVKDVVERAGVSRRTFYELFDGKEAAFLAAYEEAARRLLTRVRGASERQSTFPGRVSAALRELLELLAASPEFAHMCIVEVLAAGPEAVAIRTRVMAELAKMIEDDASSLDGNASSPPLVAETIVGGIYEGIYRRVAMGDATRLPELLPDLVESTLRPYLGEQEAAAWGRQLRAHPYVDGSPGGDGASPAGEA
jgi:AcrR family transcriptional regulator